MQQIFQINYSNMNVTHMSEQLVKTTKTSSRVCSIVTIAVSVKFNEKKNNILNIHK